MKSKLVFLFLVYLQSFALAQNNDNAAAATPAAAPQVLVPAKQGVRPHGGENDPHKESSSFMGDPENLDPMQVKKESLKDDEEPVLEDIRQVLDEPEKPKAKKEEVPPPQIIDSGAKAATSKPKVTKPAKPKVAVKKKEKHHAKALPKKIVKPKVVAPHIKPKNNLYGERLHSDEPDYGLEKKFHTIYNRYNAEPTSVEAWTSVLSNRPSAVYVVQKGDTLWSISKILFGDPNFWPKIWSINRMGIMNPHFITPGLRVKFYSGSGEQIPSLAVEKKSGSLKSSDDEAEDLASDDEGTINKISSSKEPTPIPDSLPLSRDDNYFLPPKTMQMDIKKDVDLPEVYENDILLTDQKIKSEAEIPLPELAKGACGGTHVMKSTNDIPVQASYLIFESLENIKLGEGEVYPYRYVGKAVVVSPNKVKITDCKTVSSDSLFFVGPDHVAALRSNKLTTSDQPKILGGPNIGTQNLFSNEQLLYVDVGAQPINVGQSLYVRSQLTEETSGEIKVLDKFGSIALGVLTDVSDLIERGDSVYLSNTK